MIDGGGARLFFRWDLMRNTWRDLSTAPTACPVLGRKSGGAILLDGNRTFAPPAGGEPVFFVFF